MNKKSKILLLIASVLLVFTFFFPLWSITLVAPQYPDGITMYIWVNQITGDTPSTLQNVNILNHYVGMKFIVPDSIPELQYFPYIIVGCVAFGLLFSLGKIKHGAFIWAGMLSILGLLGIYDFYLWMYDYGHNLSPTAPIKIPGMVYQPPLFGTKLLLNFEATSLPAMGSLFLGLSILVAYYAGFVNILKPKNEKVNDDKVGKTQKEYENA